MCADFTILNCVESVFINKLYYDFARENTQ